MNIFIGGAWPYANGELHLGHIAGLLNGDVLARYYRMKGDKVLYVSGSDCHGTPITIKGKTENKKPGEISNHYHRKIKEGFDKLGFSYDKYGKTSEEYHHEITKGIFLKLFDNGYVYEKEEEQFFCNKCNMFLADRYLVGKCPVCGGEVRGDECDECSSLVDIKKVEDVRCGLCHSSIQLKSNTNLYFALSKFQPVLEELLNEKGSHWRDNAVKFTQRYLNEGVIDRAYSRDLDWGIDIPIEGYEGKKIYIWMENVLGYLSASIQWCKENNIDWKDFWEKDKNVRSYYIHAKDNIPFHTIILPALLAGAGNYKLPDVIVSNEYLMLEGRKISTSKNWAIWINDILNRYHPDSVRYHLLANAPEKKDANFTFQEFIYSHNSDLVGAYGNFVNRTLVFINKYFDSKVPKASSNKEIENQLKKLYTVIGELVEKNEIKSAINGIFDFVRKANKFFDEEQPWITITTNKEKCSATIKTCVDIIYNLSNLLYPFIPFGCYKIRDNLNMDYKFTWSFDTVKELMDIPKAEILYERIDKKQIKQEIELLANNTKD